MHASKEIIWLHYPTGEIFQPFVHQWSSIPVV
jgi:hypothetical protein